MEKASDTPAPQKSIVPTAHNQAKKGQIAPTVLLPGDPERAEWAAKKYLSGAELFTNVRGIKGWTGTYNKKRVSIMASGMGGPSAGIYTYELFNFYGVQKIIRTGTCGTLQKGIRPGDLILAMTASTDSNYACQYQLSGNLSPAADFSLLKAAYEYAQKNKIGVHAGPIFSSDLFSAYNVQGERVWKAWAKMGCLAQDMETFVLYCNAAYAQKKALSILTVAINNVTKKATGPSMTVMEPMMETALSLA